MNTTNAPTATSAPAAAVVGTKVCYYGGLSSLLDPVSSSGCYDASNNTWSAMAAPPAGVLATAYSPENGFAYGSYFCLWGSGGYYLEIRKALAPVINRRPIPGSKLAQTNQASHPQPNFCRVLFNLTIAFAHSWGLATTAPRMTENALFFRRIFDLLRTLVSM